MKLIHAIAAAAVLGIGACSQAESDKAAESADAATQEAGAAMEDAGEAMGEAAEATGEAMEGAVDDAAKSAEAATDGDPKTNP